MGVQLFVLSDSIRDSNHGLEALRYDSVNLEGPRSPKSSDLEAKTVTFWKPKKRGVANTLFLWGYSVVRKSIRICFRLSYRSPDGWVRAGVGS